MGSHSFPKLAEVLVVVGIGNESGFEPRELPEKRRVPLRHVNLAFFDGLDQINYFGICYFWHGTEFFGLYCVDRSGRDECNNAEILR